MQPLTTECFSLAVVATDNVEFFFVVNLYNLCLYLQQLWKKNIINHLSLNLFNIYEEIHKYTCYFGDVIQINSLHTETAHL